MKVKIVKVPGDNHCFFHSVIYHLKDTTNNALKLKLSVKQLRCLVAKTISKISNKSFNK